MIDPIHKQRLKIVPYPRKRPDRTSARISLADTVSIHWRLLIQCLLAMALLASCSNRTELDDSVAELTLKTLSGQPVKVGDATGPLLINFWSTSCVICVKEMPDMARLYGDYADKGLELVAVAMAYDPPNHVLELAEAWNFPFPVALDINGEAVAAFGGIKGTPTSYLLDSEGRLVKRYVGAIPFDGLREELDELFGIS
ncbi:TlpA disulfide reductase family protein [Granulosicoccus sp. 3-233]|uniref:TlpA disulfide reductase family protein n=1 Tax=Granulosicoccus sp. 3-233 TaxID=3417969 RepID=UPI003D34F73E